MKVMLLKLTLIFMFVGVPAIVLIYFFHKDYDERLPARPEQLTAIAKYGSFLCFLLRLLK